MTELQLFMELDPASQVNVMNLAETAIPNLSRAEVQQIEDFSKEILKEPILDRTVRIAAAAVLEVRAGWVRL